jgi:hypothetical protein
MLLTLLLRQVLALLDPLLEPPLERPPLLLPPPVLEQRLLELPLELPLEQLERSLPLLDQLEMLDPLLVEVELDLLLRRCWSSFAAESEKERSEVLCVYIYSLA